MRIFMTGGSSPLGERVIPALVEDGHDVLSLARSDAAARRIEAAGGRSVSGDIHHPGAWTSDVAGAEVVIHLAGIRSTRELLDFVPKDARLVVVSSASATNSNHPLAAIVARDEELVLNSRPQVVLLRPTMIYGSPRDNNLRRLARLISRMRFVPKLRGGGLIQPVYVDDVASAITATMHRTGHYVSAVGGPQRVRIGDIIEELAVLLSVRRVPLPLPVRALSTSSAFIRSSGLGRRSRGLHALEMLRYDRTVALPTEDLLGRLPTPLSVGLSRAVAGYRSALSRSPADSS